MGNPHDPPSPATPALAPAREFAYSPAPSPQKIIDDEHLRLLRIGYFISAGQAALFIPFGLLYAGMGVAFSRLPSGSGPPPPDFVPWFIGLFGAGIATVAGAFALLKLLTAIRLKERRSRILCLVTAALTCFEIPWGTALGVMTFVVLARRTVLEQFEGPR